MVRAIELLNGQELPSLEPGQAAKKLLKRSSRKQVEEAMKVEGEEFFSRLHSAEAKEALTAFIEKRAPNFSKAKGSAA